MSSVRSKDGTTISYDRKGDGPAIIYVGPALGYRAFDPTMAQIADLLAPHFTVFTYDRRGRGESGDTAPYAVEREIEDIAALIAKAGGQAYVYGHSSGAVLSLDAVAHGLPITKLALYEPPFIVDDSRPPVPHDFKRQLSDMIAAGRRGDAAEFFMTQAAGEPLPMDELRNSPAWPMFEGVAPTTVYDATIMEGLQLGNPLPATRWAAVTIPTLVMDGGASPAFMRHAAQALAKLLPNTQYRTLEGQTHGPAAEVLAPALAEFFAA
jgi:pimeloyl-ACP methyl ester carboxylesterase